MHTRWRFCLRVTITRAMFGLRPKALLFFVLQQAAELWNVTQLRAASNQTRKLRRPTPSIQADYDQFWLDSGGFQAKDRNFTLPASFAPRESKTIKPKKRALYRHRYEMLAGFSQQILANLLQIQTSSVKSRH